MALTGRLDADFSAFTGAVNGAVTDLNKLMAAEVSTQAQQDKVNASVDNGTKAYATLGATAPAAMDQVAAATRNATDATETSVVKHDNLHQSLNKFDGVLASVGINISKEARALGEVADAAGKTTEQVGLLGTAGLALGTGIAAWNITRAAMEFANLDHYVESAWRGILFMKPSNEVYLAQQDAIANAVRLGADAHISYADAVKYLTEKVGIAGQVQKAYDDGIKGLTLTGQNWRRVLSEMDQSTVDQAKHWLDVGASQKDVQGAFKLTESQIRALVSARAAEKDATKEQDKAQKDYEKTLQDVAKVEGDVHKFRAASADDLTKIGTRVGQEYFGAMAKGADQVIAAEAKLHDYQMKQSLDTTSYQVTKIWEVVDEQEKAFKGSEEQRAAYNAAVEALAAAQAQDLIDKAYATKQAVDEILIPDIGHGPETILPWSTLGRGGGAAGGGGNLRLPGFGSAGAMNAALGEFYDQFIGNSAGTPGRGMAADIFAPGSWGGQSWAGIARGGAYREAAPITNNFNLVDTADNLARKISDILTRDVYRGSKAGI